MRTRKDREEGIRHIRAHSLAHILYPDLIEIKEKIRGSKKAISRQLDNPDYASSIDNVTQHWKIGIPEGFQSAGDSFYFLGTETASCVSELHSLLNQHNRVVEELINRLNNKMIVVEVWAMFAKDNLFKNRFEVMDTDVTNSLDLVGKIRDKEQLPEYTLKARGDQTDSVPHDGAVAD